jgi:hypothetical protein
MNYQYMVVPFQGQQNVTTGAQQLQELINQHARQGWEVVGVETVDTLVPPRRFNCRPQAPAGVGTPTAALPTVASHGRCLRPRRRVTG